MSKAKVSVLKVKPETIFEDIERLCDLAGMGEALERGVTTILKDNISWHYPFPGANTTPWQLEGSVRSLKHAGFGHAVNVTLGLPIIRTSVDHGTALDLAGTGRADAGSLIAATRLAMEFADRMLVPGGVGVR